MTVPAEAQPWSALPAHGRLSDVDARVVIVDYGVGNVGSIANVLRRMGIAPQVSNRLADIERADRLILPGIGAFDNGARRLHESGVVPTLERRVLRDGVPLLGICLGMQLLARRSEEGTEPGLGWIDSEVVRFRFADGQPRLPVPFIGWSGVQPIRDSRILDGLPTAAEFYFLHSYHLLAERQLVAASANYGYDFASVIESANIVGVQFHPEKSQRAGMALLRNFLLRF